jgi:hypothetical protein
LGAEVKLTADVECEEWRIVNLAHHAYSTGRFTFTTSSSINLCTAKSWTSLRGRSQAKRSK